jgi:amino acid permease
MNKGYIFIAIFVIIALFGIFAKMFFPPIWNWFGVVDTASAVALAVLAFLGYSEFIRSEEAVKIFFEIDGKEYDTGLSLLRKNFTRSEVMGVLGMIQKNQERYKLSFFQDKSILKKLQDIQTGKEKKFLIKMNKEEAKNFIF